MSRVQAQARPQVFSAAFDTGAPISLSYDGHDTSRAASFESPSQSFGRRPSDDWRTWGVRSERGYAEPLEDYDAPDPSSGDAEPVLRSSDDPIGGDGGAIAVQSSHHVDDEDDGKAFSEEINRLLAQVKGGAEPSREEAGPAAKASALPKDHPHSVFDRMDMSFANSFDGGVVDLDAVERAAAPRSAPPPQPRSFGRRPALDEVDVIEDLAFIRAAGLSGPSATKHYDLAPDAVLTPAIEARLAPIADAYHADTGRNVYVTSGRRTPEAQARAMYDKLEAGDDLSIYKNKEAIADIKRAYESAKKAGKTPDEVCAAMAAVIEAQVTACVYISRHLFAGAVDVRSRDMSDEEKAAFRRAVAGQKDVTVILESTPPHFHLEFK
ncbi:MAG: hypothetical protein JNL21_32980 [Myxococcales bacterium]|nr:hypothetical protein [Myxococcales bacterium]